MIVSQWEPLLVLPCDLPLVAADELVRQLGRVLNNLRQLERAAAGETDAPKVREAAAFRTDVLTKALRRVPARAGSGARLVEEPGQRTAA